MEHLPGGMYYQFKISNNNYFRDKNKNFNDIILLCNNIFGEGQHTSALRILKKSRWGYYCISTSYQIYIFYFKDKQDAVIFKMLL